MKIQLIVKIDDLIQNLINFHDTDHCIRVWQNIIIIIYSSWINNHVCKY